MNLRRVVVTALVVSAAVLSLAGCTSSTSVTSPDALSSTPPAAPSNLVGAFNQSQDYVSWTASSSPTVAAHEVWEYSDNPAVNAGRLVGTVAVGTNYLILPRPTQNSIMLYRIRARSASGTLSTFSATISVQRHGAMPDTYMDPVDGADPITKLN